MNNGENPHGKNKGYGLNQGGFNRYSGFRGKHRYLKTMEKPIEPDVKPNNELEDEKEQKPEKLEELDKND